MYIYILIIILLENNKITNFLNYFNRIMENYIQIISKLYINLIFMYLYIYVFIYLYINK
jgi:hypothetical protein